MTFKYTPQTVLLRVPGSKLKVEVRIFHTHTDMLKQARKLSAADYDNLTIDTAAYCEATPKLIPKGHLAIIFLNREDWTHGIIAHEFDHAANALLWRRGIRNIPCNRDEATPEEEMHASVMGELVDNFYDKVRII